MSEIMDGEDLAQHLAAQGPLRAEELVRLVNPLCGTLEQLQARGLRCKDLTPANVFLPGGLSAFSPKLTGHGLSDFATELSTEETLRDDVRALGALMHWAFTGSPYTPGVFAFASGDAREGAWVEPIIRRCVAERPEDRYETPLDVAQALQDQLPAHESIQPLLLIEETAREKEGDVLGNYQLIRVLGEGTMGRVFLARHMRLHRMVALKILRAEHALNSGLIQRFFQEARAVNEVSHENIVEIDDFVEERASHGGKRVYCVMELLEGQSLADVMRDGTLTISRMVKLVRQLCRALAASHQVGVIHRDIKPDNLFVTTRAGDADFLKVLDFGVAKLQTPLGEMPTTATIAGAIVGTPSYMAPEQAEGTVTDGRADLYSVGTVLYEMLSGFCPFPGPSIGQLIAQVLTQAPPPLPARTPYGEPIPPRLRAIVMRTLAKRPEDRYADMRTFEEALASYAERAPHPQRLRLPAWTPRAAAVVLASAVLAWVSEAHAPAAFISHAPSKMAASHALPAQPVQAAPVPLPSPAPLIPLHPSAVVAPSANNAPRRHLVAVPKHAKEKPSRDAVVDPFSL